MAFISQSLRQILPTSYRNGFWGECAGRPTEEDLRAIRTRKPDIPRLRVELKDGSERELWCTFGPQQIDINVNTPQGLFLLCRMRLQRLKTPAPSTQSPACNTQQCCLDVFPLDQSWMHA